MASLSNPMRRLVRAPVAASAMRGLAATPPAAAPAGAAAERRTPVPGFLARPGEAGLLVSSAVAALAVARRMGVGAVVG